MPWDYYYYYSYKEVKFSSYPNNIMNMCRYFVCFDFVLCYIYLQVIEIEMKREFLYWCISSIGTFKRLQIVHNVPTIFHSNGGNSYVFACRPQWSWGNVLNSRSKVHKFKPRFFQDVKILITSSPGETLSWGSLV